MIPRTRPVALVPYRGFGTTERWYLRGRVLAGPIETRPGGPARAHRNLLRALRRLRGRPVAGARVEVGGIETRADDEGYWDLEIAAPDSAPRGGFWHELPLRTPEADPPISALARVLVPPSDAPFGVVSDVDDTVIRTDVTRLVRMLSTVLLNNAHTRLPFPGVAAFYRALHAGRNPVFYVSSSPWAFNDLLEHVWELQGIPEGPMFLRDYDFRARDIFAGGGHHDHKLAAIRTLLDTYPRLDWVLVGDSGQHDPEIYRQVVRDFPGRVRAVYIRDVTSERRDRQVHGVAEEVRAMKVPMLLVSDTIGAAEHAAAEGLVSAEVLDQIREDARADVSGSGPLL